MRTGIAEIARKAQELSPWEPSPAAVAGQGLVTRRVTPVGRGRDYRLRGPATVARQGKGLAGGPPAS